MKGFHSREDLENIRFQNESKKELSDIPIRTEIVNRPYQIEAVKRVLGGIQKGKRKFLIVQATGTGKTRVAMALIDILKRSHRAERILFLADRKALRDQAFDEGFKEWLPEESRSKIFGGSLDKNAKLYASTIQTFMECYKEFSIGAFDLIISDEAHRSIYNKWKEVFTYFDAIQIGLTATPQILSKKTRSSSSSVMGSNRPSCIHTTKRKRRVAMRLQAMGSADTFPDRRSQAIRHPRLDKGKTSRAGP